MSNQELKTLNYFVFSGPMIKDFGSYLGPVSPNCPNAPNTLKQVELNPQMATILD